MRIVTHEAMPTHSDDGLESVAVPMRNFLTWLTPVGKLHRAGPCCRLTAHRAVGLDASMPRGAAATI